MPKKRVYCYTAISLKKEVAEMVRSKAKEAKMGINEYQGNKAQRKLMEKGLIESLTLKDLEGKYWGKAFKLTEKGKALLESLGYSSKETKRMGGILHQHIIKQIEDLLTKEGLKYQKDFPVGNGRTVDLLVEGKTVVEVETGESNIENNLSKLSELDYNKIVVCSTYDLKKKVEEMAKNFEGIKVIEAKEFLGVLKFLKS